MSTEPDSETRTDNESDSLDDLNEGVVDAVADKVADRVSGTVRDELGEDLEPQRPDDDVFHDFLDDAGYRSSSERDHRKSWDTFRSWFRQSPNDHLSDIGTSDIASYKSYIPGDDVTVNGNMENTKQFIDWCQVRDYVTDEIDGDDWQQLYPDLSSEDLQRDEYLDADRGVEIMEWLESERKGTREHVAFILTFRLGLRKSACLALDDGHLHYDGNAQHCDCPHDIDGHHLRLRNRPELGGPDSDGLPLKKRGDSEPDDRYIPLRSETFNAIQSYREERGRADESDQFGLRGLLQTKQSARMKSANGHGSPLYREICWVTSPATYAEECYCSFCRDREGRLSRKVASKCENSRGPHAVRHGAITHAFNRMSDPDTNLTPESLSHRVGTSVPTLKQVYDRADAKEKYERHRDNLIG